MPRSALLAPYLASHLPAATAPLAALQKARRRHLEEERGADRSTPYLRHRHREAVPHP